MVFWLNDLVRVRRWMWILVVASACMNGLAGFLEFTAWVLR